MIGTAFGGHDTDDCGPTWVEGNETGARMVASTVTVTADVVVRTSYEAAYVPGVAKADGKLMVTVPWFTPVVGETASQLAVGVEIDHFKAPLPVPALLIFTTWDGTLVPAYATRLSEVGVTASTACADADHGMMSPATKT